MKGHTWGICKTCGKFHGNHKGGIPNKGHNWGICKKCGQNHGEHPRGAKGITAWNKGIPLNDEHKENLRRINTGKKMSEEMKKKNSLSHLGKKHPNTSETLKRLWQTPEFRLNRKTTKGRHHSLETIEKIRLSNIGWKHTPESRLKISQALKGRKGIIPWNKGLKGVYHHSPEIRKIMSQRQTGRKGEKSAWFGKHHSEESKRKLSESHKGQIAWNKGKTGVYSEETLRKMSETRKTKFKSGEWDSWSKGRKKSPETLEKMKVFWSNPENKIKHSIMVKKRYEDPLSRIKWSEKMKKSLSNPNIKPKWSASMKKKWCDEEYRNKVVKSMIKRPNKMEKFVQSILDKNFPNEWKFVGDFSFWIEHKNPDFINCNGQKKIIEVFGDRWHNPKFVPFSRTEEATKEHYKKFGFDTLIIWGSNLTYKLGKEKTERDIIDFHNKPKRNTEEYKVENDLINMLNRRGD